MFSYIDKPTFLVSASHILSTGSLCLPSCFVDSCCNLSSSCRALQSEADAPGMVETVTECLDKVFSSRYGASLLPSYGVCVTFSQFFI